MNRRGSQSSNDLYENQDNPKKLPLIRIRHAKSAQKDEKEQMMDNERKEIMNNEKEDLVQCQRLLQRLKKITKQYHDRVDKKRRSVSEPQEEIDDVDNKTTMVVGNKNSIRIPGFIRDNKTIRRSQLNEDELLKDQDSIIINRKSSRLPPQHWNGKNCEQPFRTPRSEAELYSSIKETGRSQQCQSRDYMTESGKDLKRITVRKPVNQNNTRERKLTSIREQSFISNQKNQNQVGSIQQDNASIQKRRIIQDSVLHSQSQSEQRELSLTQSKRANSKYSKKNKSKKLGRSQLEEQLKIQKQKRRDSQRKKFVMELEKYREIGLIIDIEKQSAWRKQKQLIRQFNKQKQRLEYDLYREREKNRINEQKYQKNIQKFTPRSYFHIACSDTNEYFDENGLQENNKLHLSQGNNSNSHVLENEQGQKNICQIIILESPVKQKFKGKTQYIVKTVS